MQEQGIAMALLGQDRIAEKLESIKQVGHISEYLVTWRGSGGQLDPNVTVWTEPDDDRIKLLLARCLSGLVPSENIRVLADQDASA
jgi:hypothetical protein